MIRRLKAERGIEALEESDPHCRLVFIRKRGKWTEILGFPSTNFLNGKLSSKDFTINLLTSACAGPPKEITRGLISRSVSINCFGSV